jgi:hypothetical protein
MPTFAIFWGLLGLSAGLSYAQHALASPVLAIFSRWARWALFVCALTVGAVMFLDSGRPPWLFAVTGLVLWPLVETMFTYVMITALSFSALPLFPRFTLNREGDAWPNQRRFIILREWLRAEKFHHIQSLKSELAEGQFLRVSVFHDAEAQIRLQVMFIPQALGNVTVCFVLSSETQSGARLITDNVHLPYGGFYPENWEVERHPWMRLPQTLLRRHLRRLAARPEHLVPFADEPVDDLNRQQQLLERTNTEWGFLFPRNLQEEHGRLTGEGRYRVWKETWLLNYFGIPFRS